LVLVRNRPVRLILAALLAAAVLAACGSSKDSRSATTKKVTTTTGADNATVDTAAGTPSGSQTTAANNLKNSGQPGTTAKPSGTPSANSGTSPPASKSGLQPTAPGKYQFAITGFRRAGTPATTQPLNDTSELTVDPATGADQHSNQVDKNNAQASQEETLRYQADGIYLVDLKVGGGIIEFKPDQPVLQYPEPATVGKAWEWTTKSTDGGTTVNTKLKVLRTENQTVGSETVPTTVIDAVITTSGNVASTTHSTIWVSEKYRMIVRTDSVADITQPVFVAGHSETSSKLVSTKPS
jgi:hypothetical protein